MEEPGKECRCYARRVAGALLVAALAMAGYEAARASAVVAGVVYAKYGFLVSIEKAVFGAPLALMLAMHRNAFFDAVFGLVYLSHPAYFLAVLAWLAWRRPRLYKPAVVSFAAAAMAAVILYFLAPTAPPWIALPGVTRTPYPLASLLGDRVDPNPYAAFPSMHVALAAIAAYYVYRATGRRLVLAWPAVMTAATIYTGNHYLLDALSGLLLGLASSLLVEALYGRSARVTSRYGAEAAG